MAYSGNAGDAGTDAAVRAAPVPAAGTGQVRTAALPRQLTSFVGRERELGEITRLLAEYPLVTLTGTGGVGKTRLALRAAAGVGEAFPDGVWFVDLAPLTPRADPALVAGAALAALGAGEATGQPALAALTDHLRERCALLILDNCEHVLEACVLLADAVTQRCPGVRLLATSREPLGVPGERAWRVPPLTLPAPEDVQAHTARSLERYEAVRLFTDRARAVAPAFAVTDQNAPAVAQVCARLDGVPLALELAAARVRVLSVEQIDARLDDRFRLLTGGGRTALRRQQTLQALVDWSHDLLTDPERTLFRRLAAFAGGFTLEAAETVCAGGSGDLIDSREVLDLLTSLVDKSLVVAEPRGAAERYRLHETMRQYAAARLLPAGEDAALRDRHLDWCVALAGAADDAMRSPDLDRFGEAQRRYNAETDNVRAALAWGAATPEGASRGLDLLAITIFAPHPSWDETVRWLETLLAAAPARTAARARALLGLDHLRRLQHDFAGARIAADEARDIADALGDEELATEAASRGALLDANLGEYASAVAALERFLDLARAHASWSGVEQFTRTLGGIALAMGDFPRARALLTECLDVGPRHGSKLTARPRLFLTIIDRLTGDLHGARTALEALSAEVGDWDPERSKVNRSHFHEPARWALANIARDEGRFDEARRLLAQSLAHLRRSGEVGQLRDPTCLAGLLAIAAGHTERGVTLVAACAPATGPIGTVHVPEVRLEAPAFLERARATLGRAAYEAAWARGRGLTLREAVELALEEAASLPDAPPAARHAAPGGLSPRETQVAALIARGLTNREIAAALVVTEHTAMRHVENILAKLGLRSRTQIAAWAVAQGVAEAT